MASPPVPTKKLKPTIDRTSISSSTSHTATHRHLQDHHHHHHHPQHHHPQHPHHSHQQHQQQQSVEESIKAQLKTRMVVSGEWLRLSKLLVNRLKGSEWEQSLRCQAEHRALQPDLPSLSTLIDHLRPIAQNTIPIEVQTELHSSIRQFVESNLDPDDQNLDEDEDEEG